jgi:hypothetical protein
LYVLSSLLKAIVILRQLTEEKHMYSGSDNVVSNLTVAILSPLFQFQTITCHSGMPDRVKIASLFENSTLKYSVAAPSKI